MYVRSYGTEREAEMVPVGLFTSGSDLTWSGEWSRTMEQWLRIVSHVEHRLFPVDKTTAVRTRLCPLSPRCCWYTRARPGLRPLVSANPLRILYLLFKIVSARCR